MTPLINSSIENLQISSILQKNTKKMCAPSRSKRAIELYSKYWKQTHDNDGSDILSANPDALEYLRMRRAGVDWDLASKNPRAVSRLMDEPDNINYYYLSSNPSPEAMLLIEEKIKEERKNRCVSTSRRVRKDPRYVDWDRLSENPAAVYLLKAYPEMINWYCICKNPAAIELIREELRKPRGEGKIKKWNLIAGNPAAMDLILETLKSDPYLINWDYIFSNPSAIDLIRLMYRNRPELINWTCLYENPAAMDLIEEHLKNGHGNNTLLKQLGEYNYWTSYNREAYEKGVAIVRESKEWKKDIRALFDRSDMESRAKLDVKKYNIIVRFENIQKSLYAKYSNNRVIGSDRLIAEIERRPNAAIDILNDVDPIRTFEEMKLRRNNLAHEQEEQIGRIPESAFGLSFEDFRKLRDYRTLKHFSFIQTKLMSALDARSWKIEFITKQTNWNSTLARDLLGSNPERTYIKLKASRNKIAHLLGEKSC